MSGIMPVTIAWQDWNLLYYCSSTSVGTIPNSADVRHNAGIVGRQMPALSGDHHHHYNWMFNSGSRAVKTLLVVGTVASNA